MTRPTTTGKAQDLITFTRSTTGTALAKISYGEESVTNGDFSSGSTGWNVSQVGTFEVVSGRAKITSSSGNQRIYQEITGFSVGKAYTLSLELEGAYAVYVSTSSTSGSSIANIPYAGSTAPLVSKQLTFTATSSTLNLVVYVIGTNNNVFIDNVSVKEVLYDQPDGTLQLFNHPINKPRIEYDASGNCLGLLVEEARTNLFRYSQELSNVDHSLITTDNATVSPDGTQNASLCIPTSANIEHHIADQTVTVGTDYAMSCFAKYGSGSYLLAFRGSAIGANSPRFDLQTGTVVNEGASSVWSNTKIEDVGNGWYKCSSVGNPNATSPLRFQIMRSDGATTFTGDGTGHYIWGIQIEQNSFPTSYIPTSGSAVTRTPDVASLAVSEFGYNQDQGTVVVEAQRFGTNNYPRTVMIDNGSESESISLGAWGQSTTVVGYVVSSGAVQASVSTGGALANNFKHSLAYKKDDFGSSRDGGAVVTDTSGVIPATPTTLRLGRNSQVAQFLNGHIKSVQYYPLRLSNAQLQALTV